MSTEYVLSLGYNSGHGFRGTDQEAWDMLVAIVESLRHQPERILEEARRFHAPEYCCDLQHLSLADVVKAYQRSSEEDGPLSILCEGDDPSAWRIVQWTTGDRTMKEHVRRAFSRLVIADAHRRNLEVCFNVQ